MAQNELKQMGASVLQEVEGQPSYQNKDDVYLARMGKRPVLQNGIGWLTVIGWQATYATGLYLNGNFIEALVILTNPDYTPAPWRKTLYSWATAVFAATMNIIGGKLLPRFEGTILILHILGFFAILIPLTYMAEHKPASEVFTYFINEGHWPTQGLSFFIGIIGPVFAFAGGDAAVHVRCPSKEKK
ncbi:unnamed protein product [Aspergillus oryzae]|uniref:Unnamed protein product n=1 Tax=Aspergillus oryzae TaxID=5062 RepID=A0AAN4YKE5_ASPOZ|nr:unnamed protein product [Aspergillus oryzae]GMF93755.1 unnamed protein product [Aspergillus oryzae]GMG06276.1 unnamed protein product [Aspergillus oryzae]GMG27893.1 unnamed protein product [Aspergillus oryzae]